jgi:hypothetical protein
VTDGRVDLAQLVRFLVVELTYPGSNPTFDMSVVFTANFFSVGGDVPIDSEALIVVGYVCVYRGEYSYMYEYLYLYYVSKK